MAENSITIYGLAEGHRLRPATEQQVRGIAAEEAATAVSKAGVLTVAEVEAIVRRIAGGGSTPPGVDMPTTPARRAIILGDSHSDWFWPQATGVWWWQVAADLAGLTVVDNVSVGGMTTRDALKGWAADTDHPDVPQIEQAEASDADLALMEFGGNDLAQGLGLAEFKTNLATIIKRLQDTGKRVMFIAPPPLFPTMHESRGVEYGQYRAAAEETAKANGAYYGDGWDLVGTGPGGSLPAKYDSGDGVHMNAAGQIAYGRAVAAKVQAVAAVADPFDGTRDREWYLPQWQQGDVAAITKQTGPDDALFKGQQTALVVSRPGEVATENAIMYYPVGSPGTRWEVSYSYRMEADAYPGNRVAQAWADWPMGRTTYLPHQLHSVGQEGVRRYETIVPDDAKDGRVFSLEIPRNAGDLRIRVGALGLKQLS